MNQVQNLFVIVFGKRVPTEKSNTQNIIMCMMEVMLIHIKFNQIQPQQVM